MKAPLSWLKDYVDIDTEPGELADKLTAIGLPVEAIHYTSPEVSGVFAGKIIKMWQHPNADKLRICDLDLGVWKSDVGGQRSEDGGKPRQEEGERKAGEGQGEERNILQIITGAPNVKEGDIVPVALHGAKLSGGLKIKKSKIRGEVSNGMMCSSTELGLDIKDLPIEQREGVLVFPPDTPLGESVIKLYCLDEPIFEFETFANRPDQLSMLGIAREIAGLLGKEMKSPSLDYPEIEEKAEDTVDVKILDYNLCSRYSARIIKDMEIKPSPLWLQGRLMAAGIRTINNVVDITNYCMLETGQPLHAFDLDKVKGKKIIVRPAEDGEIMKSIDGEERRLDPSMLVIADEKDPVAIAGVMGGLDSEVSSNTRNILLESANFNPASIRRTSLKLGLRSESSKRFEKGIDFYRVDLSSRRACHWMSSFGGKILKGERVDSIPAPEAVKILLRPKKVNSTLGTNIEPHIMKKILIRLDFKVEEQDENFLVQVPTARKDINHEWDLVEEIVRLWGYDNIPVTEPQGVARGGTFTRDIFEDQLKDLLTRCGLNEVVTLSMHEEGVLQDLNIPHEGLLRVKNPMNEEQKILRVTPLHHLLMVIKRNLAIGKNSINLFEISKFYKDRGMQEPEEWSDLAMIISSLRKEGETGFFELKGIIEFILKEIGIEMEIQPSSLSYLHPHQQGEVFNQGEKIGEIGAVHPLITGNKYDIPQEVVFAKLNIASLMKYKKDKSFVPLPKFPGMARDIALIVDEKIPASHIQKIILESGKPLVQKAECFDVYRGKQIPEGKKNLAFSLYFMAEDRTLTDSEVDEKIANILDNLKEKAGTKLRV